MSNIKISLDSSGESGKILIVRVDGVIDTMTATELEKVMNSLLERSKYRIIVDLGGVDYISSAGWGIFISNIREIRQHSGDIKLARMIPNVYEIFELLEFDSILRAFDSIEKAKNDFNEDKTDTVSVVEPVLSSQKASIHEKTGASSINKDKGSIPQTSGRVSSAAEPRPPETKSAAKNIESMVLDLISKDPFYSISEIKNEIAKKHGGAKAGWWKIWGILRRNGLLSKKNRFRKARNKTGES